MTESERKKRNLNTYIEKVKDFSFWASSSVKSSKAESQALSGRDCNGNVLRRKVEETKEKIEHEGRREKRRWDFIYTKKKRAQKM